MWVAILALVVPLGGRQFAGGGGEDKLDSDILFLRYELEKRLRSV